MFGVAVVLRGALGATPEARCVVSKLEEYGVPHVVLSRAPKNGAFRNLPDCLSLTPQCIWLVMDGSRKNVQAALSSGFNVIWVTGEHSNDEPANAALHVVASMSEALDVLSEPYTRSVLALHSLLRAPEEPS